MQMRFLQLSLRCGVYVKAGVQVRVRHKVKVRVTGVLVRMGWGGIEVRDRVRFSDGVRRMVWLQEDSFTCVRGQDKEEIIYIHHG